jgi:hypothetical protein
MVPFGGGAAPAGVVLGCRLELHVAMSIETRLAGHEIVLAAPPDEVAVVLENLEQVALPMFGVEHVVHGPMAAHVRIPPGHEAAAAGRADGILAERRGEGDAVAGDQGVEVGRDGRGVARMPENVSTPLVRIEDDDVRLFVHDFLSHPC